MPIPLRAFVQLSEVVGLYLLLGHPGDVKRGRCLASLYVSRSNNNVSLTTSTVACFDLKAQRSKHDRDASLLAPPLAWQSVGNGARSVCTAVLVAGSAAAEFKSNAAGWRFAISTANLPREWQI